MVISPQAEVKHYCTVDILDITPYQGFECLNLEVHFKCTFGFLWPSVSVQTETALNMKVFLHNTLENMTLILERP